MLSGYASLVGTHLSAKGYSRLCGGIILQQRKVLRPSEMLALLPEDINFSEDSYFGGPPRVDIALGSESGTKSGREQSVTVYVDTDPDVCLFLKRIVQAPPPQKYSLPTLYQHLP